MGVRYLGRKKYKKMKLGYAIPCHGYEDKNLIIELLESISLSTVLPDEVSISFSGVEDIKDIKTNNYNFPIHVTHTSGNNSTGKNRNIAVEKLNTDIISFFDADDLVHPQRNEILLDAFTNEEVKVLVHNLYIFQGGMSGPQIIKNLVNNKNFRHSRCKIGNEFYYIEKTNLLINYHDTIKPNVGQPENSKKHLSYANGHVTLRKEIFEKYKYQDVSRVEDTRYNLNLLKNGFKFSHILDPLMIYRP